MKPSLAIFLLAAVILALPCRAASTAAPKPEPLLSFSFSNLSAILVAQRIADLEKKKLVDQLAVEIGAIPVSVKVEGQPLAQTVALLREALLKQAGVLAEDRPDGTVLARATARLPVLAPPPPPDKTVNNLYLQAASLSEALNLLSQLTDRAIETPPDVLAVAAKIDFAQRDPVPSRAAAAALREALVAQAGVFIDELPGGKLAARLLPKPVPVFPAP